MGTAEAREDAAQVASHQARLQKIVLSWDYYRLLSLAKIKRKKRKKTDEVSESTVEKSSTLRHVPEKFEDLSEYLAVFEGLLLEECRAQILRGEEEGGGTECHMVILTTWEKANEFYFVRLTIQADVAEDFTENDLLLLSKEKPLGGTNLPSSYAFATVETREGRGTLRIRMHLDSEVSESGVVVKAPQGALCLRAALPGPTSSKSAWWLMKLCNLSTILREYTALRSVASLPFLNLILSADSASKDGKGLNKDGAIVASSTSSGDLEQWIIPVDLKEHLSDTHNDSQMQALQAGLKRKPLVLIQGPPGTGKTQTILGLLSVILHSTPARVPSKNGAVDISIRPELPFETKNDCWIKASSWLGTGVNPRDLVMPIDGDHGYFPVMDNAFRPQTVAAKRKSHAHVLVCAPSNSALDEIVLRLMRTGLRDENGKLYAPNIVRVGLNVHHSVQSVAMDTLVQHRLSSTERSAVTAGPRSSAGMERDRVRIQILDEAAIVCSTLSFSGAGIFKRMNRGFDVVVIDEAAQAVEPSTLVPLMHGCRQVFLVGDPLQLPATVLSTTAVEYGYGTSLFRRFQKGGYPVQMLKIQYRMHPQIREFPSKEFYSNTLEDGAGVEQEVSRPWHEHFWFGPFVFFDIAGKESQPPGSGSWINKDEAEFVLLLYRTMVSKYPQLKETPSVAVISPYKQQVKLLRYMFCSVLGVEAARMIDINTVDGFQGREKDVAIFSCVRADPKGGIGFVSDFRRMNVGLTRARASMLVIGCSVALKRDKHWKNLVRNARDRGRLLKVAKPYHAFFSDRNLSNLKTLEEEATNRLADKTSKQAAESLGMESRSANYREGDDEEEAEEDEELYPDEVAVNNGDFDEDDDETM